ncbi:MAG: hypothetical protein IH948_01590 [Bacteroidetes bacterium]|nr:hypothetical protein [Bacteroidota bacterium]
MNILKSFLRKKIDEGRVADSFIHTLIEVSTEGYPEVVDFINTEPGFDSSPEISTDNIQWFLQVVFAGNLQHMHHFFPLDQLNRMREICIRKFVFENHDINITEDSILHYEEYIIDLKEGMSEKDIANAMAKAIFYRCELNEFQDDHFQKLNVPNPTFLKDLNDILVHFLWNWTDLLGKYKVQRKLHS